uniref:Gp149.1 n=1 Tax=Caviid herpesvirus 2 str. CIDMTR TaxID=1415526 RepID=U6HA20_9BETA|nr:gp149.1 [Caviid herpesvirus 2 str. CIDMTR]
MRIATPVKSSDMSRSMSRGTISAQEWVVQRGGPNTSVAEWASFGGGISQEECSSCANILSSRRSGLASLRRRFRERGRLWDRPRRFTGTPGPAGSEAGCR